MKLVLDVGSLVERVSLRVFVTASHSLMLCVEPDRWFFSGTSLFSRLLLTRCQGEETSPLIFCLLATISLRIPWAVRLNGDATRSNSSDTAHLQ
jgi:hypothetical protein